MTSKYGSFSYDQIMQTKLRLRKSIFFLLLYVDPETRVEYTDVNIFDAFRNIQYKLNGMNRLLLEPPEIVETMSLLEAALIELENSEGFNFTQYRKLILDAGASIMKIKGGD